MTLVTASGHKSLNGTDRASNGKLTRAWYSKLVQNIKAVAGSGQYRLWKNPVANKPW